MRDILEWFNGLEAWQKTAAAIAAVGLLLMVWRPWKKTDAENTESASAENVISYPAVAYGSAYSGAYDMASPGYDMGVTNDLLENLTEQQKVETELLQTIVEQTKTQTPTTTTPTTTTTTISVGASTATAKATGQTTASVTWGAAKNATAYDLYMATSSAGPWSRAGSTTGNVWSVKGLKAGTKYYFKIRPYYQSGSKKTYGAYSNITSATTAAASGGATSGSSATAWKYYTVQKGDTLSGIAAKLKIKDWHTLYNDNKSIIGADPNKIYAGQKLKYK